MEEITSSLKNITITRKVLYYSIGFNNYKDLMELVCKTLESSKIYTKSSGIYEFFGGEKVELNKIPTMDKFEVFIDKMEEGTNFIIQGDVLYTANSEFHITTLFTSGKSHEKSSEMESSVGKKTVIKLNKLAISHNFIVFGVESIKYKDGEDVPYYGNPVKHITIALNKTGKKVFPKDSYTALTDGIVYDLDYSITGVCGKVTM